MNKKPRIAMSIKPRIAMGLIAFAGLSVIAGNISRSCRKEPPRATPKQIYDAQMYMRFRGEAMKNMPEARDAKKRHTTHAGHKTP